MSAIADPAREAWVAHATLQRTPTGWRTVVAETPEKITHGRLLLALPSDPLDLAAAEFERTLRTVWGVERPVSWRETERGWWLAELGPGPLVVRMA
ncbi:MAG TPA: hypothetical protein VFQ01_05230 [Nocardioides sp.]|nr:hypothetical protein [Nocardioides sp.]